jgi:hypothetical protein
MPTSVWIAYVIISLIFVGATVICLCAFRNPHFGEKLLRNIGNFITREKDGKVKD